MSKAKRIVLNSLQHRITHCEHSLGNLSIAATAIQLGDHYGDFDITMLSHPPGSTAEIIAETIISERPDLCGFSSTALTEIPISEATSLVKGELPRTVIVIGGPSITQGSTTSRFTTSSADLFVHGDGELAFTKIIGALCADEIDSILVGRKTIGGVSTKETISNGSVTCESCNLSDVSSPYCCEDGSSFFESACGNFDHLYWETSRGCVYRCAYCAYSHHRRLPRCIPFKRLESEVQKFDKWGVKSLFITDPILGGSRQNTKRVLRLISSIESNPEVSILMRGEYLDQEMIDLLSQANVWFLDLGLQTINESLDYLDRKNNIPLLLRRLEQLRKASISYNLDLIAGFPGETMETMCSSLRFVIEEAKPDSIKIFLLRVYPGTPLHDIAVRKGKDWVLTDPDTCLVELTWSCSREEIRSYMKFANFVAALYRFLKSKDWFGREEVFRKLEFFEKSFSIMRKYGQSDYSVWHTLNCPQNSYDSAIVANVWFNLLREAKSLRK